MAFKVVVSLRAQKEIINTIDYYALNSKDAPSNFITVLNAAYKTLEINPFVKIRYKKCACIKTQ